MVGAKENGVISRGSPHDQVIEELIGRLIRNVLSDPHNFNTLTKLMALSDANNNPGKNRPHPRGQPIGNRPRDISNNEIIRPRDLPQITGLSRTTIWRLSKSNRFVPRIQLSDGAVGYDKKSILKWLKEHESV